MNERAPQYTIRKEENKKERSEKRKKATDKVDQHKRK